MATRPSFEHRQIAQAMGSAGIGDAAGGGSRRARGSGSESCAENKSKLWKRATARGS
jgi:hypothetical protein